MISVFELFKIGIGPSSSHTVGPMKAAAAFVGGLVGTGAIDQVASIEVSLMGSLAFTGRGHATDKAVILGLSGEKPDTVDLDAAEALVARVRETKALNLAGRRAIPFDPERAIVFDIVTPAPRHPNTMRSSRGTGRAGRSPTRPGSRSAAGSSSGTARAKTRHRANCSFPIRFARGPSFSRAGAKLSFRSPNSCGPTRPRCDLKARRMRMPSASST